MKRSMYTCTRDANLINLLEQFFTGCKINRDWKPKALLESRESFREFASESGDRYNTNAKLVRAFIADGNSLTTDDISEVLGVDKHYAAKMLNRINNN